MLLKNLFTLFFIFFAFDAFAQMNEQLCKTNEKITFAFQLKNKKWVTVCEEKNRRYIVYRFGNSNKVELEYPTTLDSSSYQQFTFKGYSRGGGKQNAAMNYAFLNFIVKDVNYEIYDTWNSEDNKQHCGISITVKAKPIDMVGNLKSRKGYLLSLWYDGKIKTEEQ